MLFGRRSVGPHVVIALGHIPATCPSGFCSRRLGKPGGESRHSELPCAAFSCTPECLVALSQPAPTPKPTPIPIRCAEFINNAEATGGRDCRAGAFYHFQARQRFWLAESKNTLARTGRSVGPRPCPEASTYRSKIPLAVRLRS